MLKTIFYDFFGLNEQIFFLLNGFAHTQFFDEFLLSLAFVFKPLKMGGFLVLCFNIFAIRQVLKSRNSENLRKCLILLISSFVTYALVTIFKASFGFMRPICIFEDHPIYMHKITVVYENIFKKCYHSLPSGHSAIVVLLGLNLMAFTKNAFVKICVIFIIVTTMISRVMIAFHFPADVIYGALLAIGTYYSVRFIINKMIK